MKIHTIIDADDGERSVLIEFEDDDPGTARMFDAVTDLEMTIADSLWPEIESKCLDYLALQADAKASLAEDRGCAR